MDGVANFVLYLTRMEDDVRNGRDKVGCSPDVSDVSRNQLNVFSFHSKTCFDVLRLSFQFLQVHHR